MFIYLDYYLKKLMQLEEWQILVTALIAITNLLFPADARIYQAMFMLIALDTVTGVVAAMKVGLFNSRTWRTKLFSKTFGYLTVPAALYAFSAFFEGTPLEGATRLAATFTLGSISLIEVTSILENVGAITGKRITLKWKASDIEDLIEANHVPLEVVRDGDTDERK